MKKRHLYVMLLFICFMVIGCQEEEILLSSSLEKSSVERNGSSNKSKSYLDYGNKLTSVLTSLIDKKETLAKVLESNAKRKDGNNESLITDIFKTNVDDRNLTGLQIFSRELARNEHISVDQATAYLTTRAEEMPNVIIALRNNITTSPSSLTPGDLAIRKVVFVNGEHRVGNLLFGYDSNDTRVQVVNEVFLTVQVSERHDDQGNSIMTYDNPFFFGPSGPVGPLGELTPSQVCDVESIPEPDGPCDTPNTPTNFTVTMQDGFIQIVWNSDLEEAGSWNRYVLERRNPVTGEIKLFPIYSCGYISNQYLVTDTDLIPNTTYIYRVRSVVMRKFPFGSSEDYCRSAWTNSITVQTDASLIVDPVQNFETRNYNEGFIEYYWSPPASYQSTGYKIEASTNGTNSSWSNIEDITDPLEISHTEGHPAGWKGNRQHFRIRNKLGANYSLPVYDVVYPAWRDSGDRVRISEINIPDITTFELPELGMPEIFIASTIATDEDAGTKTSEGIVGLTPKLAQVIQLPWPYQNFQLLIPFGNDYVPSTSNPIYAHQIPYAPEIFLIQNSTPITLINNWYGDYYNKVIFVNISETDTGEITTETFTETKEIDAKGTFKIGKKDVFDIGLDIGAKKASTVVFDYPDKTLPMGAFDLFYWEEINRNYSLQGSNIVLRITD
ncbi:fibronectin type III domain-containing protein [Kordia sp. YSTF-M3]|uniref:Fibronectin type III domain-containing protein n=1 Tax=Kordia aestuariivivens TaxID=2759037 RepID=A0ABR7QD83_9FLAO|nr:fibronectin type III domain-containing protein [Kordia aestuariivivens]MBC8756483.1 fibronectin type III domain-containing protein [Kordia aestuariivivens]